MYTLATIVIIFTLLEISADLLSRYARKRNMNDIEFMSIYVEVACVCAILFTSIFCLIIG